MQCLSSNSMASLSTTLDLGQTLPRTLLNSSTKTIPILAPKQHRLFEVNHFYSNILPLSFLVIRHRPIYPVFSLNSSSLLLFCTILISSNSFNCIFKNLYPLLTNFLISSLFLQNGFCISLP